MRQGTARRALMLRDTVGGNDLRRPARGTKREENKGEGWKSFFFLVRKARETFNAFYTRVGLARKKARWKTQLSVPRVKPRST